MRVIISGMVWLPLGELSDHQINNIKRDLTIQPRKTTDIQTKEDPAPIFLFEEDWDRGMIGVPRYYYLERNSGDNEELLDVSYGRPMRDLQTNFKAEGPYVEQETMLEELALALEGRKWGGVILQAAPGTGKTIISLEFARRIGRKTLILVHKDFLVRQWKERIQWLMPDARVGIIKQKVCEFDALESSGEEPDFVIGLMQSLARDDGSKYPDALYSSIGTVIGDEIHRVASQTFSSIIPRFKAAWRAGLSATPKRADGAQNVFFKHISPITYAAKTQMMRPKIRKIFTESTLRPISRGNYKVSTDNLNSAQVLNQLAADKFRTRHIVDDLVGGVVAGRKILVVSERLEHLKEMGERLGTILFGMDLPFTPRIDYYTGQWFTGEVWEKTTRGKRGNILHRKGDPKFKTRTAEELKRGESANVLLATKQIIIEGFDVPPIDVLVMATPMGDVEQVVGRIQRWCLPESEKCKRLCPWRAGKCEGKPQPIVVDVVDEMIPKLNAKHKRRLRFYRKIGSL